MSLCIDMCRYTDNTVHVQGATWDDGCNYRCVCVDAKQNNYRCDARYDHIDFSGRPTFEMNYTSICCSLRTVAIFLQNIIDKNSITGTW